MLPFAPAYVDKVLSGDPGALAIALLLVGIVVGILWAIKVRDPSVNRKKYR